MECRHTGMHSASHWRTDRATHLRLRREPDVVHAANGRDDYSLVGAERFAKVMGELTAEMNLNVDGDTLQFLEGIAVKL